MIAPVFVDTNVFVYARDAGEPAKRAAARAWLEFLWRERCGRTSVQVLSEYYVTVTRKLRPGLTPDDAWDDVNGLFAWRPQALDDALLERAYTIQSRHRLSWWDSLVVAAALAQDCALLLTEDLQDGGIYDGLTARSPFKLAAGESVSRYDIAPQAARRHPTRGRPRRISV